MALREKDARIYHTNLPVLQADALMMRQLFQNLLSNAVKFGKAGATQKARITGRSVSLEEAATQGMDGLAGGLHHLIGVRNDGTGTQYATRIFQIFQRLHGRSEYPGTGVGLSIVQKLVDVHGGKIAAEGRVGEGLHFTWRTGKG